MKQREQNLLVSWCLPCLQISFGRKHFIKSHIEKCWCPDHLTRTFSGRNHGARGGLWQRGSRFTDEQTACGATWPWNFTQRLPQWIAVRSQTGAQRKRQHRSSGAGREGRAPTMQKAAAVERIADSQSLLIIIIVIFITVLMLTTIIYWKSSTGPLHALPFVKMFSGCPSSCDQEPLPGLPRGLAGTAEKSIFLCKSLMVHFPLMTDSEWFCFCQLKDLTPGVSKEAIV